jgi:murein L,D-transpeptidase YafK
MDKIRSRTRLPATILLGGGAGLLAGCDEPGMQTSDERARVTIPPATLALMESKGTSKSAPVLIRTYKKEAELEVWKMKSDGRYVHLKTFPMCRWSGQLGPKSREGDRQVPEGFYAITPAQMNPKSAYYLSFNVGYPNIYDRAMGRSGGSIMVHGACSSAGCFSMTDKQIAEIYAIAREGFSGGQRSIQMQSYPFRMNAENLAKYRLDPNIGFWAQLKDGSDNFEVTKQEVAVGVCGKRYVFNASASDGSSLDPTGPCPGLKFDAAHTQVVAKQKQDETKVAELVAQGAKPMRTVYADGGQHPDFAFRFTNVSRPDALIQGPVDMAVDDTQTKKLASAGGSQLASQRTSATAASGTDTRPTKVATASAEPNKSQDSWFAGLGRWFGGPKAPEPEAAPVAVAAAPTNTPVPPRRNEADNGVSTTSRPAPYTSQAVHANTSTTVAQAQPAR